MIKKCFQCNKVTYVPYKVTEVLKNKEIISYDLCKKCGDTMANIKPEEIDLTKIQSPEQLLALICGVKQLKKESDKPPCPECGLTISEFEVKGRFGCQKCYEHFDEKMQELVYPYHKGDSHVGKTPKKYFSDKCNSSVEEKTKLLKLRLAKAIELEEYEKASDIKIQIQEIQQSSLDQ